MQKIEEKTTSINYPAGVSRRILEEKGGKKRKKERVIWNIERILAIFQERRCEKVRSREHVGSIACVIILSLRKWGQVEGEGEGGGRRRGGN